MLPTKDVYILVPETCDYVPYVAKEALKTKILATYFYREGGRKRGGETSMCKRNIDLLPFMHPHPGT